MRNQIRRNFYTIVLKKSPFLQKVEITITYMKQTGRSESHIKLVKEYLKNNNLFYVDTNEVLYSGEVINFELGSIVPCCAGPKRPQVRVALSDLKKEFEIALTAKLGNKGFGLKTEDLEVKFDFEFEGEKYYLEHGILSYKNERFTNFL